LAKDGSADVAVYVVWSSQVGGKEQHVDKAAQRVPDPRARHYWDDGQLVGNAFRPVLKTPEAAWDVWMLFAPGVRWEGETPPQPAWWEHQLWEMPSERLLDSQRFAKKAREIQARRTKAGSAGRVGAGNIMSGQPKRESTSRATSEPASRPCSARAIRA
jgi:hypothetical protein